jgi:hypothetical protein
MIQGVIFDATGSREFDIKVSGAHAESLLML